MHGDLKNFSTTVDAWSWWRHFLKLLTEIIGLQKINHWLGNVSVYWFSENTVKLTLLVTCWLHKDFACRSGPWNTELYASSKPIPACMDSVARSYSASAIVRQEDLFPCLKSSVRYGRSRLQKDALLDWIARWLFDRFIANRIWWFL